MKHHDREFDPEFAYPSEDIDYAAVSSQRQQERKTRQFCRQVQRALNLALSGQPFVDEVLPAPDCGRLLVYFVVPDDGTPAASVLRELAERTPALRAEVASAVNRKRARELHFLPVAEWAEGEVPDA